MTRDAASALISWYSEASGENQHQKSPHRAAGVVSQSGPSLLFAVANARCLKVVWFLQDCSRLSQLPKQGPLMRVSVSIRNPLVFLIV